MNTQNIKKKISKARKEGSISVDQIIEILADDLAFDKNINTLINSLGDLPVKKENVDFPKKKSSQGKKKNSKYTASSDSHKQVMNYFGEINRFAKMNREDEIRFSKLMEFFSRRLAHHLEEKGVPKEFRDLIPALDGCKKSYEGDEIVPLCDKVGACPHGKKGVIRESCVSFSELRGEFVERNLHLVTSLSSQYRTYGIPLMDLIQEGNAALIRAVEKYDWRKGVRFQTYATFWIRQAVERCISANKYIVRVPNYLQQKMRRLKREGSIPADSSNLSIREVSDSFELSSEVAEHIIETGRGHVSIDSPSPTDNSRSLTDILYTEEKEVMPDDEVKTLKRRIKEALKVLNEQEQFIIHHRFGLEGKETKTLDEIGKLLRVSRERIRQIQIQALKKLKRPSLEEKLVPFIA